MRIRYLIYSHPLRVFLVKKKQMHSNILISEPFRFTLPLSANKWALRYKHIFRHIHVQLVIYIDKSWIHYVLHQLTCTLYYIHELLFRRTCIFYQIHIQLIKYINKYQIHIILTQKCTRYINNVSDTSVSYVSTNNFFDKIYS